MRRLVLVALLALAAIVVPATPAAAHAQLTSTSPGPDAVVEVAPAEVRLEFSENVSVNPGAVKVFDSDAERLDRGAASHGSGDARSVVAPLRPLGAGTYVVAWRVTSADSHPISGAFSFSVGVAAADSAGLVDDVSKDQGEDPFLGGLLGVSRALLFGALVLLVGCIAYAFLVARQAPGRRPFARCLTMSAAMAIGASSLGVLAQGPYTAGLGVSSLFDWALLRSTIDTPFGEWALVRVVMLAMLVPLVLKLNNSTVGRVVAGAGALAVLATVTFTGHAVTGRFIPVAVVADIAHMAAASVWLGGLVMLVAHGLRLGRIDETLAHTVRFSKIALPAVAVVVATGTFQGWRQLGTLEELFTAGYGQILLIKVALVAAMILIARRSRAWVQKGYDAGAVEADPGILGRIRRHVGTEVGIGIAVVVMTAALVNAVPGEAVASGPQSRDLEIVGQRVQLVVDPSETGLNEMHVYVMAPDGRLSEVQEVKVSLSLPAQEIDNIPATFIQAGPGHYVATATSIPIRGDWTIKIDLRMDEFTQRSATTQVTVR